MTRVLASSMGCRLLLLEILEHKTYREANPVQWQQDLESLCRQLGVAVEEAQLPQTTHSDALPEVSSTNSDTNGSGA
jgi:hypothetical protein